MTKNFKRKWKPQHRAELIHIRWVEATPDGRIIRREETYNQFQKEGGSVKTMFLMYVSWNFGGRWETPNPKAKALWKAAGEN